MGRRATGQVLTAPDRRGGTTYSVRFRGQGYPRSVVLLGSSRDGWTRARAEHEAQIVAAQIRAGSWMPLPKPEYVEGEPYTFRELASDYYHRKRRRGLRASSLADMLNKLQAHLLPFFGDYRLDQIDEQLVEDYIEHKQRENDRLAAAASIRRPVLNKAGRPHRPRGGRHDRHAIARHVIAPSVKRADGLRAEQGLPPIGQHVTPHTLRYTYIASMFAAGADQEYVAAQVGHEDITTTNRIYRYVLRRKVRGEIGERRRQLLTAPLKTSDADLTVLLGDTETA